MGHTQSSAPSVFPLKPCCSSSNEIATIGCFASGFLPQPVNIQWKSSSGSITSGIKNFPAVAQQSGYFASSSQLTIPISRWNSESFTCTVTHGSTSTPVTSELKGTSCNRTPKTSIMPGNNTNTKPSIFLYSPRTKELEKDASSLISIICLVKGFYPKNVNVTWQQNGSPMNASQVLNSEPQLNNGSGDNTYAMFSMITISKDKWKKKTWYTCNVRHMTNGNETLIKEISVGNC
uniref:Ig-like domain-containing protein n=1 Tax=Xenopus tropicalis TaxID=8364 RepID=A0A6I8R7U2_XENTR